MLRVVLALLLILCGCASAPPSYYAFVDKGGQVKIRFDPHQGAASFSEGLAGVSRNGRWGFINYDGQWVIEPKFGWVGEFSDGLAAATLAPAGQYWAKDTLFGYIDKSGRFVAPPRFNWVSAFSEGLAAVCAGPCRNRDYALAEVRYIDRTGKDVIPPRKGHGGRFREGLAPMSLGPAEPLKAVTGYIDRSGRFLIEPRFAWASEFNDGLAATSEGFINRQGGVVVTKERNSFVRGFSEGLLAVSEGNEHVFVDRTGTVRLRTGCQAVGPFSEGLAAACVSGCGPSGGARAWGFIDKSGRFVISAQFGFHPSPFREGMALVCFGCEG